MDIEYNIDLEFCFDERYSIDISLHRVHKLVIQIVHDQVKDMRFSKYVAYNLTFSEGEDFFLQVALLNFILIYPANSWVRFRFNRKY